MAWRYGLFELRSKTCKGPDRSTGWTWWFRIPLDFQTMRCYLFNKKTRTCELPKLFWNHLQNLLFDCLAWVSTKTWTLATATEMGIPGVPQQRHLQTRVPRHRRGLHNSCFFQNRPQAGTVRDSHCVTKKHISSGVSLGWYQRGCSTSFL